MTKRLLEYDETRGLSIFHEVIGDGKFAIHYEQDVEPIIDMNKAKQLAGRNYYASDNDVWRVASVPITVRYEWIKRYGTDPLMPENQKLLASLLNDPEWRYLKTAEIII